MLSTAPFLCALQSMIDAGGSTRLLAKKKLSQLLSKSEVLVKSLFVGV